LVNAQASYQAALDNLTNILGLRVTRQLAIEPLEMAVDSVAIDEEAWVARALHDNPLIEQAKLECERADLSKRLAGNERLPQLDVSVSYDQLRAPISSDPAGTHLVGQVAAVSSHQQLGSDYTAARLSSRPRTVVVPTPGGPLGARRRAQPSAASNASRSSARTSSGAQAKVEYAKVNFQLGCASNLDITDAQKDLLDAETDRQRTCDLSRGLARLSNSADRFMIERARSTARR
jgi:outer membrane protein TolC